jgi:dienelactone hydrolase
MSAFPQAALEDPARGKITENVTSLADSSQSYALYLPSSYVPGKKWPVLYVLDPGARGELPVRRFKDGAEKYGYIVVGSNNSRNGPIAGIQNALNAVLADTSSRLSLDAERIYMAGFSGGARAAILIGHALKGKIAGAIVCGGGFPPSMQPSVSTKFPLAMAVGTEDYFFSELRALNQLLYSLDIPHHLEIFDGGHEWPPESVCTSLLEWLELQAMESGISVKDELFIDRFFNKAIEKARERENSEETYEACLQYSALVKDFTGLRDVKVFEAKIEQLQQSGNYEKARKQEKQMESRQRRSEEAFNRLVNDAVDGRDRSAATRQLHSMFEDLAKKSNQTKNETDRLIARRVLTRFRIQLSEAVSMDFIERQYGTAVMRLELMKLLQSDHSELYFHIARAYSLQGKTRKAIEALKNAVRAGFADVSAIESSRDFESLRNEKEFQALIKMRTE